jgi:hypothetical protein
LNAKSLTIGGALVLLAVTLIGRLNGLITDDRLLYAFWALLAVTLSAVVSYIISWASTDGYKKYNWPPNRWGEQAIKKKIFKVAWVSAGTPMALFGAVILVATTTGKALIFSGVVWLHFVALVSATSPWLWCFVFDNLMPRLKRWARGDDFEGENEAMDRPSEVPRE